MASFDAGAVVEALNYDFSKFGGGKGTIAEPTDDQIREFGNAMIAEQIQRRKLNPPDGTPDDKFLEEVQRLGNTAEAKKLPLMQAKAHSALCSGTPSAEDIMKLPQRIRNLFYAWLQTEVSDPEAVAGGGNAQA